jgi:hypothetical protein
MRTLNRNRTLKELGYLKKLYNIRSQIQINAHWLYQIGIKLPKRVRF